MPSINLLHFFLSPTLCNLLVRCAMKAGVMVCPRSHTYGARLGYVGKFIPATTTRLQKQLVNDLAIPTFLCVMSLWTPEDQRRRTIDLYAVRKYTIPGYRYHPIMTPQVVPYNCGVSGLLFGGGWPTGEIWRKSGESTGIQM